MDTPLVSAIVILLENRVIGRDNKVPWTIKKDLKRLRTITMGHPLVMGRKTYESIGRPLPGRTSIVISRNVLSLDLPKGVERASTIQEATNIASSSPGGREKIFIFGGGEIFKETMELISRLYLTIVHEEIEGDVYFPDYSDFKKVISKEHGEENGLPYTFLTLERY